MAEVGAPRPILGLVTAACLAMAAPAVAQILELRTPDETVAPGGVLQVKLELTDPRPITTGGGGWGFADYNQYLGFAVSSPSGDAAAVGVRRGASLRVLMQSPSGDLGTSPAGYPILTATLAVPANAPVGRRSALTLGDTTFLQPDGSPYTHSFRAGVATVATGAWVSNVTPGSRLVRAGETIVIVGNGFVPGTIAQLGDNPDIPLSAVRVIDARRIEVVPAQDVVMHGLQVRLDIPSPRQRLFYYAYQRTSPLGGSTDPLIGAVEPAFPRQFWRSAAVRFPAPATGAVYGVALQNEDDTPTTVSLSLADGGLVHGPLQFVLPANARESRSLAEVFGASCAEGCVLRMTSSTPIQLFGLAGDRAADAVTPVLPEPYTPVVTALDLSTVVNAATVRTGDLVVVTAHFSPGAAPVMADAYVVLLMPSGEYWSLTPSGIVPGIRPRFRGISVTAESATEVVRVVVPPGLAAGSYQWLSALAQPGTLNLLTPIRVTPFDVVP